jgi:uncharacterized protein YdeI (BOF family)
MNLQLIVDALLFSGCTDIMSTFSDETREEMVDLAIKICAENPVIPSDKVSIYGDIFEEPELAKKILETLSIKHWS